MDKLRRGKPMDKLRELFIKYLTVGSLTKDRRRKEFNQAIFIDPSDKYFGGNQVFKRTDLDMVLEKFDKAVKEYNLLQRIVLSRRVSNERYE